MSAEQWIVGFHAVLGVLEEGRGVDAVWLQRGRRDGRIEKIHSIATTRGVVGRRHRSTSSILTCSGFLDLIQRSTA